MDYYVHAQRRFVSHVVDEIPGDKSISHRAIILGSLCTNTSVFTGFLTASDCLNTLEIFRNLGVSIERSGDTVTVHGVGLYGLKSPGHHLDVGNSGTGIRLITGVLAGLPFDTTISGDSSIQNRPMRRIVSPLREMGAKIDGQSRPGKSDIYPPLTVLASDKLRGINYTLPVASAQVKSAILLAGMFADSPTTIHEPEPCRDHTERMMSGFGMALTSHQGTVTLTPSHPKNPNPTVPIQIPADFSSAAFFMVLGAIATPLRLTSIGLNHTRDTLLHVLIRMGANITVENRGGDDFEPYGDILVSPSQLQNTEIRATEIPFIIDEIPILAVAAMNANGTLRVRNATELRVKESDRISAIVSIVSAMGGTIREYDDGFEIDGKTAIKSFTADSRGDHRIAMSAIIGAVAAGVDATIKDCDCINTSFPNFFSVLHSITQP
ncbi:3-phosphoshikimate 1-carboxyvinyltransferase [bacterium]|nr:3-phosphoshikimate 1-carboxyvinyltransferase [bacterium]